jgi:D-glycero-alpha-D-manno-heptose-7-phosphate kinase
VNYIDQIAHPAVRATFRWAKVVDGLEIHHDGDLPARSGLGSSSAFTVGLVHALYALKGKMVSKRSLANDALHIEQNLIGENVGSQDQISAAFGGFNRIDFRRDYTYEVSPVLLSICRKAELLEHLMLFFTGFSRTADAIAKSKIDNFKNREAELKCMYAMVDEAQGILTNSAVPIEDFGKLLGLSWRHKRSLSDKVSTPEIDEIYNAAMDAGALGGKILGAGGGGFMLIFAKPEKQATIRARLKKLVHVDFNFDDSGSRVVLYQPNGL